MLHDCAGTQTKNRDRSWLGAGHEANSATGAACSFVCRGAIAVMIELLAQMNCLGRTRFDAQPAPFALIYINSQEASVSLGRARSLRDCHGLLLIVIAVSRVCGDLAFQVVCAHRKILKFLLEARI